MRLALAAVAATVADVNKTTLSLLRAIKAGKVSGKRNERRRVVGAELHGICPPAALRAIPRSRATTHRLRSRPKSPACARSRSSCAASSRPPARTATVGPKRRWRRASHDLSDRVMILKALVLAVAIALVTSTAGAQDVPGVELCTVEKSMVRRTSCLQSKDRKSVV